MKIAILNTSIITTDGTFKLESISLDSARQLVDLNEFISAVGHESTAQILTELLNINVPVNRINYAQETGQKAIVFKLKQRAKEGEILTRKQIDELGYEFKLLTRIN